MPEKRPLEPRSGISRRGFLTTLVASGAGMGLTPTLLSALQQAFAIEPAPGTTWEDAEHVVFLMQENRAFDHLFGSLQGVRGFNDPHALTLPTGLPVWCQATATGDVYPPFHLDLHASNAAWMGDHPHNWPDQVDARNDGRHDRWIPNKTRKGHTPLTMGYHTRADIPFYYALADAFTICDQYFCSSLTGTTSNRLFFWSGTNREGRTPDSLPHLYNADSDHSGILKWTSYPERLTRAGIPWKFYQNQLSVHTGLTTDEVELLGNFGLNVLEFFAAYKVRFAAGHHEYLIQEAHDIQTAMDRAQAALAAKPDNKQHADELAELTTRQAAVTRDLATWHPDKAAQMSEVEQTLHRQAFVTNARDPHSRAIGPCAATLPDGSQATVTAPLGDLLAQFRADVAAGQLPPISWLAAPRNFSDHPCSPWYGTWYIAEVLNILSANPDRWRKTILVITYDENDGLFDHHPPFVAPSMTDAATGACSDGVDSTLEYTTRDRTSPIGLGYRVPMIIASPWTRGGYVNSQVFDHTSSLRFLEHFVQRRFNKEVREDNITSWRRAVSGDLTSVFRPAQDGPVTTPTFPDQRSWMATVNRMKQQPAPNPGTPLTAAELEQIRTDPASSTRLPRQEPGSRPANPLPYDLMADGTLTDDRHALRLGFQSLTRLFTDHTAGAPFQVIAPGKVRAPMTAATAAPTAGAAPASPIWQEVRTWNYAVAPGSHVNAEFPLADFADQRYYLRILGPNGFFREVRGGADDPALAITADTEVDTAGSSTGGLRLRLRTGAAALVAHVVSALSGAHDLTQPLPASAETIISIPLVASHGWYDVTVRVEGATGFVRRYAGRIETGRPTRTDGAMGKDTTG